MRRVTVIVLASALLASLLAVAAGATRRPTPGERYALRTAVEKFIGGEHSPAARDNRIVGIVVSSDPRYARVDVVSKIAGPALAILRATSRGWKVVTFGSGGFGCNLAPRRVLKDLIGGCVP